MLHSISGNNGAPGPILALPDLAGLEKPVQDLACFLADLKFVLLEIELLLEGLELEVLLLHGFLL